MPGIWRGQTEHAWCLTLATNTAIAWIIEYYGLEVERMLRFDANVACAKLALPDLAVLVNLAA
nr:hypothetical protein [Nocardia fluminea]